jgi:putative hydrolase of the HAD superfamily
VVTSIDALTAPVRALLLDSGGVLVRPDGVLIAELAAEAGISVSPALSVAAIHVADRNQQLGSAGNRSFPEHWAEAVGCSPEQAARLWNEILASVSLIRLWSVANPDARVFLNELSRDIPRYVVTNSGGDAHHELRTCGLRTLVDGVLDSTQVGICKPDVRLFHMAAIAMQVRLDDCLYISDTLDAPKDGGVRRALYDPLDIYGADRALPVELRVTQLTDLLPLFSPSRSGRSAC